MVVRGWTEEERTLVTVTTEERPEELCLSKAYAVIR
jgi:hypothetical protein